jgi:hypothetical protein
MKYLTIVVLALLIPAALFAAPKNSAKVTFNSAVTVNGTQVPAGDYRVEWQGSGDAVQASILQGKKVVATAPAKLINGKSQYSEYDGAVELGHGENNSSILEAIDWKKLSLRFDQTNGAAGAASPSVSE